MLWPDEAGEVEPVPVRVDRVAVAGVVGPRPRHGVVEEVAGDVLDVGEQIGDLAAGRVGDRVQRQAAVADQHGRDAVQRLGVERRIPEHLRIGVAVGVDEAGRHDRAGRVDLVLAVGPQVGADLDDAAVADPHVGPTGVGPRAVDDVAAADQQVSITHVGRPPSGARRVGPDPRGRYTGRRAMIA